MLFAEKYYEEIKKMKIKMKRDYQNQLAKIFPFNEDDLEKMMNNISFHEMPPGTVLLSEGEVATKLYIVFQGCLRQYFIKENGDEITSQFFIENQMVASFESAMSKIPSRVYIETIENSTVGAIPIKTIQEKLIQNSSMRDYFTRFLMTRLIYYMNHYASYILDNPEERYNNLMKENPELIYRLPKRYIASYLGITPVSLSRIRTRIKKRINNC
jgi:CRP-like cAMP-binding protein